MKALAWLLVSLGLLLCLVRTLVLGFDFGLLSVWLSDMPFSWAKLLLDFSGGWFLGAGAYLVYFGRKEVAWDSWHFLRTPGK